MATKAQLQNENYFLRDELEAAHQTIALAEIQIKVISEAIEDLADNQSRIDAKASECTEIVSGLLQSACESPIPF